MLDAGSSSDGGEESSLFKVFGEGSLRGGQGVEGESPGLVELEFVVLPLLFERGVCFLLAGVEEVEYGVVVTGERA